VSAQIVSTRSLSSQFVPYARMLGLLPGLGERVVHLGRAARAVAHS
jgi:hypothetical protein